MEAAQLEEEDSDEEDVIPPPSSPKEASGGAMLSAADGAKILVRCRLFGSCSANFNAAEVAFELQLMNVLRSCGAMLCFAILSARNTITGQARVAGPKDEYTAGFGGSVRSPRMSSR